MRIYNGTVAQKVSPPTSQKSAPSSSPAPVPTHIADYMHDKKSNGIPHWVIILLISVLVALLIYGVWKYTRGRKDFGLKFY
jgi:hypothetical protein